MKSEGRLLGIAARARPRAAMQELDEAEVTLERGVAHDSRGRQRKRQVTVLAREAWETACAAAGKTLPWTARRANLLVEGIELEATLGRRLRIGSALLEVTAETDPCERMDAAHPGLRAAMEPEWRGGASCRVIEPGRVKTGDAVRWA